MKKSLNARNITFEQPHLVIAKELAAALVPGGDVGDVSKLATTMRAKSEIPDVAALLESVVSARRPVNKDNASAHASYGFDEVARELKKLSRTPGALENLAMVFAEKVFLNGGMRLGRLRPAITEVLKKCSRELSMAESLGEEDCAPQGMKKAKLLRGMDKRLIESIKEPGAVTAQEYVVLNDQHKALVTIKRKEDATVWSAVSKPLREHLSSNGLSLLRVAKATSESAPQELQRLIDAGIVDTFEVDSVGALVSYASGEVTSASYDALLPSKLREKVADALWEEFQTRYASAYRPIGIYSNRESQIPTLSDRKRVGSVAEKVHLPASVVVLALKNLHSKGLVEIRFPNNGFELSELAKKVGLGIRATRYVERLRESGTKAPIPSLEDFCEQSSLARDSWKMPTYCVQTKDGGAPWIHLLDELLFPNARVDASVLRSVSALMKSNPGLIIASNMMQGDPAVFPRDQRTTLHSQDPSRGAIAGYDGQLKFVKKMLESFAQPSLLLFGKRELETANLKADVQRVRDQQAIKGAERPTEGTVGKALARLNDIELNAGRKYAARLQAANLIFMANVIMPFEFKIGREVMSSDQVHAKAGLRLNEVEIVRDLVTALERDTARGGNAEMSRMRAMFVDFFALPEVGPRYVESLEQVVYPRLETLRTGAPVGRGGAVIQLKSGRAIDGLSIIALPEFKMGVGELRDPGRLISMLKSRAVAGRTVADIVICGSVGAPFFSMLSTGQAIVAPGSLQASNFDDLYTFTESVDGHKRRRVGLGEERHAGHISFQGGVHQGVKTGAYRLQMTSAKIEEVLAANRSANKPSRSVEIFQTNDLQLGSPTACPAPFVRGLLWAVDRGVKDIVLDGDLIQGQNYGRFYAEAQMTGIIGIEDQQAYLSELFEPVLDLIIRRKREDPSFELPKIRIIVGNHEMNSQAGKGAQGNWYMQPLYNQIYHSYRAAFGAHAAHGKVVYPRKYTSHDGTSVDYPIDILDYTEETGFRLGAQHYSGAGAKGSGSIPPIVQARAWNRSKENENREVHGWLWAHFHTQSIMMADGVFHAIFGANATGSGFEHHLGYPLTVPAAGMITLSSDRPPELQIVTEPYLSLQESTLRKIPEYSALCSRHGSLEEWIEVSRRKHQGRDTGHAVNMRELKKSAGRHKFLELQRQVSR